MDRDEECQNAQREGEDRTAHTGGERIDPVAAPEIKPTQPTKPPTAPPEIPPKVEAGEKQQFEKIRHKEISVKVVKDELMTVFERLSIWLSLFTLLVLIATFIVFYLQLRESKKQTDVFRTQARQAAIDASSQIGIARQALSDSQKFFQIDQRPYVWNSAVQPLPMIPNQRISANVYFANYGKSPALDVHGTGAMFFGRDALKQADAWFESIGTNPLNKSTTGTVSIIAPGIPPDPQKANSFTTILSTKVVTSDDITFILKNDFSAVIVLRQQYSDTGGNNYYTDMCFFHLASNAIAQCKSHNEIH
jgi:hypothetical protein